MDLCGLRVFYEKASEQIDVLDTCLSELHQRCQQSQSGKRETSDYLHFKISTMTGLRHMYTQYRDQAWKLLQTETTSVLREVLYDRHSDTTLTLTPPTSEFHDHRLHTPTTAEDTPSSYDMFIDMGLPLPISPIRDFSAMERRRHMAGLRARRSLNYFSTDIGTVISELSVSRDL